MNTATPTMPGYTPALTRTLHCLVWAGAVPFVLPLISLITPDLALFGQSPMTLLAGYSLAIACFMAGTLWRPGAPDAVLVISNLLTLSALALALWQPAIWLPGMALIFALIAWTERRWMALAPEYAALRERVTWTVKIALLFTFILQLAGWL